MAVQRSKSKKSKSAKENGTDFLQRLGPGLITGAADDDPSGIATYSQVGSQFGFSILWTMLFSLPLMAAIQEISARLGRITGKGIADGMRNHYPKPVVYILVFMLCLSNIFNLGADFAAMGSATKLVMGGKAVFYVTIFGVVSIFLQVFIPYRKYVRYLKWLTLTLFAYVASVFVIHVDWLAVIRATILPTFQRSSAYWMALVGVLGTTISPYLFFWQSSQEAEEVRIAEGESPLREKPWQAFAQFRRIAMDTRVGMAFSNLIGFFIVLTTAAMLYDVNGGKIVHTAADAAQALKPLLGQYSFLFFGIGIIGAGMLAVPVLACSAAYAVAELFRWHASLESKPRQAREFYAILTIATLLGIALNFVGLDPIRALFLSAVVNGLVAAPVMILVMLMSNNKRLVGEFVLPSYLRILGWTATAVMVCASLTFLGSLILPMH
jgi:NRAMP (natural resistance-associated macrophage protein)-like metal ion transporter